MSIPICPFAEYKGYIINGSTPTMAWQSRACVSSVFWIVVFSDLKTTPFLRFQSCQQQRAMKVLKCLPGI